MNQQYDPVIVKPDQTTRRKPLARRSLTALLGAILLLLFTGAESRAQDILENAAVILAYFHVGEDGPAASSLGLEDFHEHLVELKEPDLTPLPVPQIISLLKQKKELPDGAIGITFEGAYKSLLERAIPALLERGIPFTIFLSPQAVDDKNPQYMDWNDIQTLRRSGLASFGLTLPFAPDDEAEFRRQLNKNITLFREALGVEPRLFAHPNGRYTQAMKDSIAGQAGFEAAFGLQSGAIYEGSDFRALPRFTMTGAYGDLERLEGIVRTLPLPADYIEPEASLLDSEEALIGFSLAPDYKHLAPHIRCLASNQGRIEPQVLGESRIEIRPHIGWGERLRVNCTVSARPDDPKNETLRWIGFLLYAREDAAEDGHGNGNGNADGNGNETAPLNPEQAELPRPPE